MARLSAFTFISLNGFYKGIDDTINWHQHGGEEAGYSVENLKAGNILLFGRITYEMMKSFWPTEMAYQAFPEVAEGMNTAEKLVVSRSLKTADWNHTRIISDDLVGRITELKQGNQDITLLGSGTLLKQLSDANLVDEYQIMIDPVFIEGGTPILNHLHQNMALQLTQSRVFKSGILLLHYQPKQ